MTAFPLLYIQEFDAANFFTATKLNETMYISCTSIFGYFSINAPLNTNQKVYPKMFYAQVSHVFIFCSKYSFKHSSFFGSKEMFEQISIVLCFNIFAPEYEGSFGGANCSVLVFLVL